MPSGEVEMHPYLNEQIDVPNEDSLTKYRFLIIGTFPIYAITTSTPIDMEGNSLKTTWHQYAHFKFFYGSIENHFWDLFSNAFNQPRPQTSADAIALLDANGFVISDVVSTTEREYYSPSDRAINANKVLNTGQLRDYLNKSKTWKPFSSQVSLRKNGSAWLLVYLTNVISLIV